MLSFTINSTTTIYLTSTATTISLIFNNATFNFISATATINVTFTSIVISLIFTVVTISSIFTTSINLITTNINITSTTTTINLITKATTICFTSRTAITIKFLSYYALSKIHLHKHYFKYILLLSGDINLNPEPNADTLLFSDESFSNDESQIFSGSDDGNLNFEKWVIFKK